MVEEQGSEKAFELIQPDSRPLSGRPSSLTEVARATPTMRITYGAGGNTDHKNYPLSLYRFGFSQVKKRLCFGKRIIFVVSVSSGPISYSHGWCSTGDLS
jgi:hypothetical protein